jgi:hypothetical protein
VALIAAACLWAGIDLSRFALLHDGWEYLRLSLAFALWEPSSLSSEHLRFFPGYPAAVALVSLGQRPEIAALALSALCAAACGPLTARLGQDARLAWWMIALTPSWLVYTSTVMSEGLFVLLALAALTATVERRWALAGAAAGLAVTVRPVGALLFLPLIAEALLTRDRRAVTRAIAWGVPWPLMHFALSAAVWGNPLASVSGYLEKDYAPPLRSLIENSFLSSPDPAKLALVWGTIALTVAGAIGLAVRWRRGSAICRPLLLWHLAAGLFCLLLPSSWVFQCTDRFHLAVWPTTLIGLAPLLPRRPAVHAAVLSLLSLAAWAMALRWLVNLSAVYPFAERSLPSPLTILGYE